MLAAQDPDQPSRNSQPLAALSAAACTPAFLRAQIERTLRVGRVPLSNRSHLSVHRTSKRRLPRRSAARPRKPRHPQASSVSPSIPSTQGSSPSALVSAVQATRASASSERTTFFSVTHSSTGVHVETSASHVQDGTVVHHFQGAWTAAPGISPRKGQMLLRANPRQPWNSTEVLPHRRARLRRSTNCSVRSAGTALIGATDGRCRLQHRHCRTEDLAQLLQTRAATLVPGLEDPKHACPVVEAWAGLRPAHARRPSPSSVPCPNTARPVPGISSPQGHFRNGILLAPATAVLLADPDRRRNARLQSPTLRARPLRLPSRRAHSLNRSVLADIRPSPIVTSVLPQRP